MSLEKVTALNAKYAQINAESQKNEASREAFRNQLEQYIARADAEHNFGLAAALADGIPALVKRLTVLHKAENDKLNEQVALGEKLIEAYQAGDYNLMRRLLGQDAEVVEVISASVSDAEVPEAEEVAVAEEVAATAEESEEEDDGISSTSYGANAAVPDLFAGLSNAGAAEVKEPVVEKAEAPAEPIALSTPTKTTATTLGGISFDDDEDEAPAAKPAGQSLSEAFGGDDDEEEPAFEFGSLLGGTDFGAK